MKRTQGGSGQPDYSPLLRAIMYLDEALKRGVVIGVYEDSKEVSDEDVRKALIGVNQLLAETTANMEKLSRSIVRVTHQPGSIILQ